MNLKGGYKIISLMAITLIAGAVGGDRTAITNEEVLDQLDSLKEFLDETKQLKPILLRVKDSGNEVVMANLSKKIGEDILYINADLVDASLNIMVKFAQDEDTQEIYIDEAGYLYIADVDKVASEVAKAEDGTIVDVLGLDEDGELVKGVVSGGTKLYKHLLTIGTNKQMIFVDNNNVSIVKSTRGVTTGFNKQNGSDLFNEVSSPLFYKTLGSGALTNIQWRAENGLFIPVIISTSQDMDLSEDVTDTVTEL